MESAYTGSGGTAVFRWGDSVPTGSDLRGRRRDARRHARRHTRRELLVDRRVPLNVVEGGGGAREAIGRDAVRDGRAPRVLPRRRALRLDLPPLRLPHARDARRAVPAG